MIGKKISPILTEIETVLWEFDAFVAEKPEYTVDGFRAAIKIFSSVMLDKIWELQEKEGVSIEARMKMVEKAGDEFRALVKTYTDIDTKTLYREKI